MLPLPVCARHIDPSHVFGKETQKVVVLDVCRQGRRGAMGTMVNLVPSFLARSGLVDIPHSPYPTTQN